jgi:hypothetical protein
MKVHIEVYGKLQFVKAIKEETEISLLSAKQIVDEIVPTGRNSAVFDLETYKWTKCTFEAICDRCGHNHIMYALLD